MQLVSCAAFLLGFIPTVFGFGGHVPAITPSEAVPNDDCVCTVVNKAIAGPSGKCTPTGSPSIPCFTASQAIYPQGGEPENGVCATANNVCTGDNSCTYKTMRVNITMASTLQWHRVQTIAVSLI